ncbi:hypothetical protein D9M68_631780 [compost metagenome]
MGLKDGNSGGQSIAVNGHSASGILAFIAKELIARAQHILDNARQVIDAVHAATLALEAKELLNGLTPSLALHAFSIQQEAEVTAECLFVGTEYNVELKERFKDIEKEIACISERFSSHQQKKIQLNAQLALIESMAGIYGSYRQFEEELKCLNEARKLNFQLKPAYWRRMLMPLDWTMRSVKNFLGVLAGLQVIFAGIYYGMLKWSKPEAGCPNPDVRGELMQLMHSFTSAVKYFFTMEQTQVFENVFKQAEPVGSVVLAAQGLLSLGSLSIFLAMIFLRISRK